MYKQAIDFRKEFLLEHPELETDVNDLLELMFSEIEEGGSVQNEIDHFIAGCKDLLIPDEE